MKTIIRSQLPESSLHKLVDGAHLKWEEKGREFFLEGEMYDVVKKKIENGVTVYFCIKDKEEEKLLKDFAASNDSHSKKAQNKNAFKFQQPELFFSALSNKLSINTRPAILYSENKCGFESQYLDAWDKPPRC